MADNFDDLGFKEEGSDDLSSLGFVSEGDDHSPLSSDEVTLPEPTSSGIEAFGRGALQSGTAGFADEIGSGLLAVPTYLGESISNLVSNSPESVDAELLKQGFTGDLQGKKSLMDTYRSLRDTSRARQAQVEAERPLESFAGNVAGALATIPFMPGAGALNTGKAALQAGKTLSTAKNLARLRGAGELAGLTALGATGSSEADLTKGDLGGLVEDVGSAEALVGGVVGGGIAGKKALKEGAKVVKYIPWAEDIINSFKSGVKGINLSEPIRNFEAKLNELGTDIVTFTKNQLKTFGQIKDQLKREADESGVTFNIKDFFNKYKQEIKELPELSSQLSADKNAIFNELNFMENKLIPKQIASKYEKLLEQADSPEAKKLISKEYQEIKDEILSKVPFSQADIAKSTIRDLGYIGDSSLLKSREYANIATKMSKEMSDEIKDVAESAGIQGYGINEKNYSVFKDLEDVLGFGEKYTTKEKMQSTGKLREMFEKLEKPTTAGGKARDVAETAFDAAEEVTPGLKEKVLSKGSELGQQLDLARKVQKPGIFEGAVKGRALMGTANVAGRAVRSAKEYTPEVLQDLIQQAPKFKNTLNRAIGSDPQKRNAIMFGLMQNPEFREAIGANAENQE